MIKHVIKTDNGYVKKAKFIDDLISPYYEIKYTKNVEKAKSYKKFGMAVHMANKWFHPNSDFVVELKEEVQDE